MRILLISADTAVGDSNKMPIYRFTYEYTIRLGHSIANIVG